MLKWSLGHVVSPAIADGQDHASCRQGWVPVLRVIDMQPLSRHNDALFIRAAAEVGHFDVLQWLMVISVPMDVSCCDAAAK
jgi:hypothetical protein